MNNCCVAIPIYKTNLNNDETHSLLRCLKTLHKYDIFFVTFESLNKDYYNLILKRNNALCRYEYFEKDFFDSITGYNRLMLSKDFYERFISYDYILLYQLDAYVFGNDLSKWCNLNYSYLGAPLPQDLTSAVENAHNKISKYKISLSHSFNGGASLRKTSDFIQAIRDNEELINGWYTDGLNEDIIFSALFLNKEFPSEAEARKFSFDMFPKDEFEKNGRRLPMLCHGWTKTRGENHVYNREFWLRYIWPSHYVCSKVSSYAQTLINHMK